MLRVVNYKAFIKRAFFFLGVCLSLWLGLLGFVYADQSNEQRIFIKTDYFGDYSKAAKKKITGKNTIVLWEPFVQNLERAGMQGALSKVRKLSVEYDEIWEKKYTDYLSEEEIKNYWDDLDISRLYWKNGEIQAVAVLKKFNSNPINMEKYKSGEYHITNLYSRDEALENAK